MIMKYYSANEMARIACRSCEGCGACCRGMGDTIHLDPYDVRELEIHTGKSFMELLSDRIDLRIEEGMILPSLAMDPATDACSFLGRDGRCAIHPYRPGLCRLFPLGREYGKDGFRYFVVEDGCPRPDKSKVRIRQWLGIPNLSSYEQYISQWHRFVRRQQEILRHMPDAERRKARNMALLNIFFIEDFPADRDFYEVFAQRMRRAEVLGSS